MIANYTNNKRLHMKRTSIMNRTSDRNKILMIKVNCTVGCFTITFYFVSKTSLLCCLANKHGEYSLSLSRLLSEVILDKSGKGSM